MRELILGMVYRSVVTGDLYFVPSAAPNNGYVRVFRRDGSEAPFDVWSNNLVEASSSETVQYWLERARCD